MKNLVLRRLCDPDYKMDSNGQLWGLEKRPPLVFVGNKPTWPYARWIKAKHLGELSDLEDMRIKKIGRVK